MILTDFEAMSFDCYGTLIDWEAGLSAVLVPWARERGLDLTAEQLLAEYSAAEAAAEADHPAELYPDVLARSMRLLARCRTGPRSRTRTTRWPSWAGAPG
jgi:2-haloacid dehalogenase